MTTLHTHLSAATMPSTMPPPNCKPSSTAGSTKTSRKAASPPVLPSLRSSARFDSSPLLPTSSRTRWLIQCRHSRRFLSIDHNTATGCRWTVRPEFALQAVNPDVLAARIRRLFPRGLRCSWRLISLDFTPGARFEWGVGR